jgi:hypothetical protein
MEADDLIRFWSRMGATETVHPDDGDHISASEFATTLRPVPWAGPLGNAKFYSLFLNPGLSPTDAEYEANNLDFSKTLTANIQDGSQPYFYLLGRFSTHPGFSWARSTFGPDIGEAEIRDLCVVQLVPYHSEKGRVARKIANRLPSSIAVRQFANACLIPRAQAGKIGLVVARSSKLWRIESDAEMNRIIVYRGSECRRGFHTKSTRGGRLMRAMIWTKEAN